MSSPPFPGSPDAHRTTGHSHIPKGPTSRREIKRGSGRHVHTVHMSRRLETLEGRVFCKYLLASYSVTGVENRTMTKSEFYPHSTSIEKRRARPETHNAPLRKPQKGWDVCGCRTSPAPSIAPGEQQTPSTFCSNDKREAVPSRMLLILQDIRQGATWTGLCKVRNSLPGGRGGNMLNSGTDSSRHTCEVRTGGVMLR